MPLTIVVTLSLSIRSEEAVNQMSASNLAIVFGPTLLSPPMPAGDANSGTAGALHLQDMSFQCKAIETILEKYRVSPAPFASTSSLQGIFATSR